MGRKSGVLPSKTRKSRGRRSRKMESKKSNAQENSIVHVKPSSLLNGFDLGYEADSILGATETDGVVYFLISWKSGTAAELVPAKIANVKCPQLVIRFYESRLVWATKCPPVHNTQSITK